MTMPKYLLLSILLAALTLPTTAENSLKFNPDGSYELGICFSNGNCAHDGGCGHLPTLPEYIQCLTNLVSNGHRFVSETKESCMELHRTEPDHLKPYSFEQIYVNHRDGQGVNEQEDDPNDIVVAMASCCPIMDGKYQCPPVAAVGASGDPHVRTWSGDYFNYNGDCDLKLLMAPNFDGLGNDLDLHIRTTKRYQYSYIEIAALQIGRDVLEVDSFGDYALNHVQGADLQAMAGYPIYHIQEEAKKHRFDVVLGPNENITFVTFKDFGAVSISPSTQSYQYFGHSSGLMGNYSGSLVARDGVTLMGDDADAFGQEWQITDQEPMLFRTARAPQYPQKCILLTPTKSVTPEDSKARQIAGEACQGMTGAAFNNCVIDVLASGDVDIVQAF